MKTLIDWEYYREIACGGEFSNGRHRLCPCEIPDDSWIQQLRNEARNHDAQVRLHNTWVYIIFGEDNINAFDNCIRDYTQPPQKQNISSRYDEAFEHCEDDDDFRLIRKMISCGVI